MNPEHNYLGLGWTFCGCATSKREAVRIMRTHKDSLTRPTIEPVQIWAKWGRKDVLKEVCD